MTNDQYDSVGCFNDRSCAVRVTCANTLGSPDPPTPVLLATIARPVRERLPSQDFGGFSFQLVSTRFNSCTYPFKTLLFFFFSRTLVLSHSRTFVLSYSRTLVHMHVRHLSCVPMGSSLSLLFSLLVPLLALNRHQNQRDVHRQPAVQQ